LDRFKHRVLGVFQSNDEPRLFPMRFGPTFRPSFLFPEAAGPRPNTLLDELVVGHFSSRRRISVAWISSSASKTRITAHKLKSAEPPKDSHLTADAEARAPGDEEGF
jgi:hypothetical protein